MEGADMYLVRLAVECQGGAAEPAVDVEEDERPRGRERPPCAKPSGQGRGVRWTSRARVDVGDPEARDVVAQCGSVETGVAVGGHRDEQAPVEKVEPEPVSRLAGGLVAEH